MPNTDKLKEMKFLSSIFVKKETSETEPKKSLISIFKGEKPVFEEPPQVLELPPFETEYEVVDRYWLTPPTPTQTSTATNTGIFTIRW